MPPRYHYVTGTELCGLEPFPGRSSADGTCGRRAPHNLFGVWMCCEHADEIARDAIAHDRRQDVIPLKDGECVFPRLSSGPPAMCRRPAVNSVAGAPACGDHYRAALAWHDRMTESEIQEWLEIQREAREQQEADLLEWDADGPQLVYYIQRHSDRAIKIGTTRRLRTRLTTLRCEHGDLDVLLTHCGARDREREMHDKFAALRLEGEWFRPGSELLKWIAHVRRKGDNQRTVIKGTLSQTRIQKMLKAAREAEAAQASVTAAAS